MPAITFEHLLAACRPGGASVLTSVTPLEPAAGPHAAVAPAKFVDGSKKSVFAYERRFWDGKPVDTVLSQQQGVQMALFHETSPDSAKCSLDRKSVV